LFLANNSFESGRKKKFEASSAAMLVFHADNVVMQIIFSTRKSISARNSSKMGGVNNFTFII
jgi:hypothetical protein